MADRPKPLSGHEVFYLCLRGLSSNSFGYTLPGPLTQTDSSVSSRKGDQVSELSFHGLRMEA